MTDKEKAFKGLKAHFETNCFDCPFDKPEYGTCFGQLINLVYQCLSEDHEPKRPGLAQDARGIWCTCGSCGHHLKSAIPSDGSIFYDSFFQFPKYCSNCGKAVKWDG